jgi:hypothetical protein
MAIIDIIKNVGDELGIPTGSSISSKDSTTVQLKALIKREGISLRRLRPWTELIKRYTFTLEEDVEAYDFPIDYDSQISQTYWNNSTSNPLIGPITPTQYETIKNSSSFTASTHYYRIAGLDKKLRIIPTPTEDDDGNILFFEYFSKNWVRPNAEWESGKSFSTGTYCYYNDNIYYTASSGTTGSTAPTHMEGAVSDGGLTWVYSMLEEPKLDTDICILDEELITLGVMWRFLRAKGFDFTMIQDEYNRAVKKRLADTMGGTKLNILGNSIRGFASTDNIPDRRI